MISQLSKDITQTKNTAKSCSLGIIGLGVMGRNFLLNIAEHGFKVAGYDKDTSKVQALRQEGKDKDVFGAENLENFLNLLSEPRAILLLVPAGPPVDSVIDELVPHLTKGDLIIDAGNSYFKDTDVREKKLAEQGIHFLGVGISGGEEGARHGPSIMPGGSKNAYEVVRPLFEASAAQVNGEPCVAYLGKDSAGHFVKMVHNGIEYGLMELISETYDLMRRGFGLNERELHDIYASWNTSELNSYLIEITAEIFNQIDPQTSKMLINEILDVARQLGTGMWTSQSGMEMQVPMPIIDIAVSMRNLSMLEDQRQKAKTLLKNFHLPSFNGDKVAAINDLHHALYICMIMTYAQGMALLTQASIKLGYEYNLETIARIWRGGCIIRSALLEDMRVAYRKEPQLTNLLLDEKIAKKVMDYEGSLRSVVKMVADLGLPAPAFMASLGYLDSFRSAWLPANLIQAQRDFFGSHTYERNDEKGTYHTEWTKS